MNFTAANTIFSIASEPVVVGSNPEMADMDNPRGYVFGESVCIVAENDKGYRKVFHFGTARWAGNVTAAAEKQVEAMNARAKYLHLLPVGFAQWPECRPCYGSDAYCAEGIEEQDAEIERAEAGY
jgi:hypothetical protein